MIRSSDAAIARGSKVPNQPSDGLASTRAALPANQPCVICSTAQQPVHTHSQVARDRCLGHRVS
jgi:hypothetical protein